MPRAVEESSVFGFNMLQARQHYNPVLTEAEEEEQAPAPGPLSDSCWQSSTTTSSS